MSPAIELREVFRIYETPEGNTAALQGLTLSVYEGEVVVILGPSGSGKSTLVRLLAGLDRPSAGTVRAFGIDVGQLGRRGLAHYRQELVGYADQHYSRALAPELSVRELVGLRVLLEGRPGRESGKRADELLERVGLADRAAARPFELSGGEQQRVAVCAALAHRPRFFLADEPTGELDHANAALLYRLIGELARDERCTTVLVSHDPESTAIADRVVHVQDGRVSAETGRGEMSDEAIVVGRGGWLRLPEEFLRQANIRTRATAHLERERIVIGSGEQHAATTDAPSLRRGSPLALVRDRAVAAEIRGVQKIHGSGRAAHIVFQDFDASFESASFTAVTGPSGSGKSTLLHLLAGLDLPTAGEVVVLGCALAELDRSERADFRAKNLALVGQDPGLIPFLSSLENVELGLSLRGLAGAEERRNRALDALASVGLAELAGQRASRLSAGERERAAIARALAVRPRLLLADEPTARLDQANALTIGALLARWAHESGASVICATHEDALIEQADHRLELDRHVTVSRFVPAVGG